MSGHKKVLSEQELRQIPMTAVFAALGIVLPQLFHLVGLGPLFLPMFLPVILGSMLLTWRFALALAVICPLVSWLLTNMPPLVPPILPLMLTELTFMALIISIVRVHLQKSYWLALIIAIIADRFILFVIVSAIAPIFGLTHPIFTWTLLAGGIPGIILQLITVPLVMEYIKKRYPYYLTFTKNENED